MEVKRKTASRALCILLAVLTFLGCIPLTAVFAPQANAATATQVLDIYFPQPNDPSKDTLIDKYSMKAVNLSNGWSSNAYKGFDTHALNDMTVVWCIEPGIRSNQSSYYNHGLTYWEDYPSSMCPLVNGQRIDGRRMRQMIMGVLYLYYNDGIKIYKALDDKIHKEWRIGEEHLKTDVAVKTFSDSSGLIFYESAQCLIWEIIVGERDYNLNYVKPAGGKDAVLDRYGPELREMIESTREWMATAAHSCITETWYWSTLQNEYSLVTFSDGKRHGEGGNIQDFVYLKHESEPPVQRGQIKVHKTDSSTHANLSGARFRATNKDIPTLHYDFGPTDSAGNAQTNVDQIPYGTYTVTETVAPTGYKKGGPWEVTVDGTNSGVVTLEAEDDPDDGYIEIYKSDKHGKFLAGAQFTVYKDGTQKEVLTTDGGGHAKSKALPLGTYTVKETKFPENYAAYPGEPTEWTVRLTADLPNRTFTINASNTPLPCLKIAKQSEDGIVNGIKFTVTGPNSFNRTVTTGAGGTVMLVNLQPGIYTVTEENIERYVQNPSQSVNVQVRYPNDPYEANFTGDKMNRLKKWTATLTKSDRQYSNPQGDGKLSGAKYGVYNGETLVDTYTTDDNGQFTTKEYVCGDNWSICEIEPSEGYTLDTEVHHIGAEAGNFTLEHNNIPVSVTEEENYGDISIIKHILGEETGIETPERGAEFQIWLKSAGSYDKARETERDTLTCDDDGYAKSKQLPYGVYIVHQTNGFEGTEYMRDFEIEIRWDNRNPVIPTQKLLIGNKLFGAYVKIVKTDSESGRQIPYAGAKFQIYDPDGNLVTMLLPYPSMQTVSVFETDETGKLYTPEKLPYGIGYKLVETEAPYGYVLDSTPITFDVTPENIDETETGEPVVKVERPDVPQKGKIKITKTGLVFQSAEQVEFLWQPKYADGGLAGATYAIYAAEDIITPDGTKHYGKGETADTITTGADGTAVSKELYLGRYFIVETKAPNGYVLNTEQKEVTLEYAGQEVSVFETSESFNNDRQKVNVRLKKHMEVDEKYGIGNNGEIGRVRFYLYADENITAADGTKIPKDGLIEIIEFDENGDGRVFTDLPLGKYYLKEIVTDEHYNLDTAKYSFEFAYAGQDVGTVDVAVNDGKPIENTVIEGKIKGFKKGRETGEAVKDAVFGLFKQGETEFTGENALAVATSDGNGLFGFDHVKYGTYWLKELQPAGGFLPNGEIYVVTVNRQDGIFAITVDNDKIPELKTNATTPDGNITNALKDIVIEDLVGYKHLVPGKEYTVKGVLMNKATGEPFLVDGRPVTAETTFIPDESTGEVLVTFTFPGVAVPETMTLVAFEELYKDGILLAAHADIEDPDQTVTVEVPKIGTKATVNGGKSARKGGTVTVEDAVTYKGLIPGKEYTLKGILMNKATGKSFLIDGKERRAELTFTPQTQAGEVTMTFTFDSGGITATADLVVFEKLYRDGVKLAEHTDISDGEQTVQIVVPTEPIPPQTGDNGHFPFFFTLMLLSAASVIFTVAAGLKKRGKAKNN